MNADIEVKRARVRALAAYLMQAPRAFYMGSCERCLMGHAGQMREFHEVGMLPVAGMAGVWQIDGKTLGHSDVIEAYFGLSPRYGAMMVDGDEDMIPARGAATSSSLSAGIMILEAIGDCGPPERVTERARAAVAVERDEVTA